MTGLRDLLRGTGREMVREWWRGILLVVVVPIAVGFRRTVEGRINLGMVAGLAAVGFLVWAYNGWTRFDNAQLEGRS